MINLGITVLNSYRRTLENVFTGASCCPTCSFRSAAYPMTSRSRKAHYLVVSFALLLLTGVWLVRETQPLSERIGVRYVGDGHYQSKSGWWFTVTNLTNEPLDVKARVQRRETLIRKEVGALSVKTNFFVPAPVTDLEHLDVHFTIPEHRPPFNPLQIAILHTWAHLDALLGRTRVPVTNEAIVIRVETSNHAK